MFKKPAMYLRDSVVFPNIAELSLMIKRIDSLKAIDLALEEYDGEICIITQIDGQNERPADDEIFPIGTICKIEKCLNFSDGSRKILIKGQSTFNLKSVFYENETRLIEGETFSQSKSDISIDNNVKEEIINLLKKYNPLWSANDEENKFESYLKEVSNLDDFVLKTSHLLSSPYYGVQKINEMDKMKRDLNYWKSFSEEQCQDMSNRIGKRIKLLTALPSQDKLNIIRDILDSET